MLIYLVKVVVGLLLFVMFVLGCAAISVLFDNMKEP